MEKKLKIQYSEDVDVLDILSEPGNMYSAVKEPKVNVLITYDTRDNRVLNIEILDFSGLFHGKLDEIQSIPEIAKFLSGREDEVSFAIKAALKTA